MSSYAGGHILVVPLVMAAMALGQPAEAQPIRIAIPAGEENVSILGEKLAVIRVACTDTFSAPGRPVAIISNVMVEYRPGPVRRPPARP